MTSHVFQKRLLTAFLMLVLLALFCATFARAATSHEIRSSCWAAASLSEDSTVLVQQTEHWSCGDRSYSIEAGRVLLRFDITAQDVLPKYFLSRRSALEAVHLFAFDRDGTIRQNTTMAADLVSSVIGGYFQISLPEVTHGTRQVIAVIDMPSHRMILERAYLTSADASVDMAEMRYLIILASLAGMLVMPLIFNAAFYRILREPFVLWHSALTLSLFLTILVTSGLSVVLFASSAMTLSWMTTVIFGLTVGAGAMFTIASLSRG
ncbi:hypothetical protein KQ944_03665 [Bacillus subtilis]|uniref:hypothetical protein n=1 Tax=Pseudochrobactrum asaccharolyticum TaxID=354351 RepID=UPI001F3852CD|nr:hypothetical protein [Pseudochrobactrum asaccharolyticum]MCF7670718.1 hypothetical protein [Bacillus subtilis]